MSDMLRLNREVATHVLGPEMGIMGKDSMSGGMQQSGGMMAASPSCQSMMDEAKPKVDAMTDAAMKAKAMKQMDMAKEMMQEKDEKGCMKHMRMAMKIMHKPMMK